MMKQIGFYRLSTTASNTRFVIPNSSFLFPVIVNEIAASLNDSKFVDCENYRSGCSTTDNNAGCTNNESCQ